MIKDMDREPFAKVVSFGEGVGEDFRIEIEGIPVYCPNNDSGQTADKINAAVDAREKALLDKHTARIAELERVLEELVNSFNSVVSYSSDYYSLADYEAGIPQRWTIDAKIKSVLGRGE